MPDQTQPTQLQQGATTAPPQGTGLQASVASRLTAPVAAPRAAVMAAAPETIRAASATTGPTMAPFDARARQVAGRPGSETRGGDMQPIVTAVATSVPRESYLRLRVRVVHDQMSIVAVEEVDGPLAQPDVAVGQHAYELMLDARTIATAGLPDLGVSRSYPRPGQNEHNFIPRPNFDFTVRVPRTALPDSALGRASLTLYRFPDSNPRQLQGGVVRQFGQQATTIARLPSLHLGVFAGPAQQRAQQLFPGIPPAPATTVR